jgi:hypothetical protein
MMELPSGMPLAVFENNPSTCYMLGADLEITYCNPAWDRFAAENGGAGLVAESVLNRPVLDFFTTVMRDYYADLLARAGDTREMQCQEYECSSAAVFRSFQMQIYPLKNGFAVVNSLRAERTHSQEKLQPFDQTYLQSNGLLRMCSNCRRTSRKGDSAQWDWVPGYLDQGLRNITHGICPVCRKYFYPGH